MNALLQDVRYAARGFARAPGFTALALLTLALGTGVNATVFSFVDALLLRPADVPNPSSLVAVYTSDFSSGPYGESSYPDYVALKADAPAFERLAAYENGRVMLMRTEDAAERIRAALVSAEFFAVLQRRPQIGRVLGAFDAKPGAPPAAVISDDVWRRVFASAPDILQRSVMLDGVAHAVVGVLPSSFDALDLGARIDAWIPLGTPSRLEDRGSRFLDILGRLRDGVSLDTAQAQVTTIAERLAQHHPETNRGTLASPAWPRPFSVVRHTRMPPQYRTEAAGISALMIAAALLVLVIACANVAGLLLSRASARAREMHVRMALGAGRARLVRHLLTESVLLGAGGAGLGLLLALWSSDALPSFFPAEQASLLGAGIDWRVLTYTLVVALTLSAVFGVAPALQALGGAHSSVLRSGAGPTATQGSTRLRARIVVAQITLAMVLSASAALLVRSLVEALDADLGFGARQAVVAGIVQPQDRPPGRGLDYYRALVERVRGIPGVEAVTLARSLPLAGWPRRGFQPDGYTPRPGEGLELNFNTVETGYFEAMQIPVVAGRGFEPGDAGAVIVPVVVNEVLARKYFDGDAVGRRLTDSSDTVLTVVGIVGAGPHRSLREEPVPLVYYLLDRSYVDRVSLVARAGDPRSLLRTVRREAAAADSGVAVHRVMTMEDHVGESLVTERMTAVLVTLCGGLAMVLAVVGIYGVTSFAVSRRAREIGVRVALGARPPHIVGLVLREAGRITLAGMTLGLIASAAAAAALSSFLFGVRAADTVVVAGVAVVLGLVTMAAALVPARHALGVDPITVLRQE